MDNDELLIAIKDMFDEKVEEVKHYTGVLVEKLEDDIKAVAEGHDILNRKFDSLDKKVDVLNTKVDTLDMKIYVLDKKVDDRTNELKVEMKIVKDYVIGVDAKLNEHEVILKRAK